MTAAVAPLLRVRALRRSYAGVRAVDVLDIDVLAGSITGMIGPNGCGKTPAINGITGFDRGYTGEILIDGRSLAGFGADAIARLGVSRTFQAVRVWISEGVAKLPRPCGQVNARVCEPTHRPMGDR